MNGQTINNLSMANITRRDQGALMQCKAENNDESEPAVTSLQLLVACKLHLTLSVMESKIELEWWGG